MTRDAKGEKYSMFRKLWNFGLADPIPEEEVDALEAALGIMSGEERAAMLYGYTVTNCIVRAVIVGVSFAFLVIACLLLTN